MARFVSDFILGRKSMPQPSEGSTQIVPFDLVLATTPVVGDLIAVAELPPLVECIDFDVIAPQLDSNGAPTLEAMLGIENALATDIQTPFGQNLQFGRTANGSIARATTGQARAAGFDPANKRVISLKWTTVAATWVGAGKTITVQLHLKG